MIDPVPALPVRIPLVTSDSKDKSRGQLQREIEALRSAYARLQTDYEALRSERGNRGPRDSGSAIDAHAKVVRLTPRKRPTSTIRPGPAATKAGTRRSASQFQAAYYRACFESIGEGLITADGDGYVRYVNAAARRMLGLGRVLLLGRHIHTILRAAPPDRDDIAESSVAREIGEGAAPVSGEDIFVRADGTSFPVEYSVAPIHDGDADIGSLVSFRDITERQRLKAELTATDLRFRATFEQAAAGIAHIGLDGTLIMANRRLSELLQYPGGELVGMNMRDIAEKDDFAGGAEVFAKIVAGELPTYICDIRLVTRVGSLEWVTATSSVVRDASGAPDYVISVVEPISARKQLEQALRDSEAEALARAKQLEATFDAMKDGVIVFDIDGRILTSNTRAREYLARAASPEFVSLPVELRPFHMDVRDQRGRPLARDEWPSNRVTRGEAIQPGLDGEFKIVLPDGGTLYFSVTGAPIYENGQLVGGVCVYRDQTQQRMLRAEAEEHAHQLTAILDAMSEALVVADADGRLVHANAAYRRLFERASGQQGDIPPALRDRLRYLTYQDTLGRPLPPDRLPLVRALNGEHLTASTTFEIKLPLRDGSVSDLSVTTAPMPEVSGAPRGAVCILRDVTGMHQVEDRALRNLRTLAEAAEALVSLLMRAPAHPRTGQMASDVPASADPTALLRDLLQLGYTVTSSQMAAMSILEPGDDLLRPLAVVGLTPKHEQEWIRAMAAARLTDFYDAAALAQLRAGHRVVRDVRADPPPGRSDFGLRRLLVQPMMVEGDLIGILGFDQADASHAVTGDELAVLETISRLAALVVRAQQHDARDDLPARGGGEADPLDILLECVIGGMAPAVRVLSFTRSHAGRGSREDTRDRQAVRQLRAVLRAARDAARVRSGELRPSRTPLDIGAVLRSLLAEAAHNCPHVDSTVAVDNEPYVPIVFADRALLTRAIQAILAVAADHATCQVTMALSVSGGKEARVHVRASGWMLSATEAARLFALFESPCAPAGLGVALPLARAIVEAHGGRVGIAPDAEGATLWFTLPMLTV